MGCERCDGEGAECCGQPCEAYVSREYRGGGYVVGLSGVGSVLSGLPESWARKAAKCLGACATAEAQKVELVRIRKGCVARMDEEQRKERRGPSRY
jgi:hypothetical protein